MIKAYQWKFARYEDEENVKALSEICLIWSCGELIINCTVAVVTTTTTITTILQKSLHQGAPLRGRVGGVGRRVVLKVPQNKMSEFPPRVAISRQRRLTPDIRASSRNVRRQGSPSNIIPFNIFLLTCVAHRDLSSLWCESVPCVYYEYFHCWWLVFVTYFKPQPKVAAPLDNITL